MPNSNMTLTFSHSALWKRYRDQTTIIHVVNAVRAKGRARLMTSHINIYFCWRRSLQNIAVKSIYLYVSF